MKPKAIVLLCIFSLCMSMSARAGVAAPGIISSGPYDVSQNEIDDFISRPLTYFAHDMDYDIFILFDLTRPEYDGERPFSTAAELDTYVEDMFKDEAQDPDRTRDMLIYYNYEIYWK